MTDLFGVSGGSFADGGRAPVGLPPSAGETVGTLEGISSAYEAEYLRNDTNDLIDRRRRAVYGSILDALPEDGPAAPGAGRRRRGRTRTGMLGSEAGRTEILERARLAAEADPASWANFDLDPASIDAGIAAELNVELSDAEGRTERARANMIPAPLIGSVGELMGASGAALSDPVSAGTALIGGGGTFGARMVLRESLAGAAGELAIIPGQQDMASFLGREPGDPLEQIALGAVAGGSIPVALRAGQLTLDGAGSVATMARQRLGGLDDAGRGALARIDREADLAGIRPDAADPELHDEAIRDAEAALERDQPFDAFGNAETPETAPTVEPAPRAADFTNDRTTAGKIIRVESSGNPDARNPKSSAGGLGQFIDSTWLAVLKRNRPEIAEGKSDQALLALKTGRENARLQREMVEAHIREIRAGLGAGNLPIDDGAVYLGWFLGQGGAAKVLRADPAARIDLVLTDAQIAANSGVRFEGKPLPDWNVAELVAWARGKMGIATGDFEAPPPLEFSDFDPMRIETDAGRFQFKRGGDSDGVTDQLARTTNWDPVAGLGVMVWEDLGGRQFIVEGHQRLGLARRLVGQGHDPITLRGALYREADGISADMMRIEGARVNIRRGTASPIDAAQILRDYPDATRSLDMTRGQIYLARDLARLAPEIDDAIYRGLIPENFGAAIGRTAPGDAAMQSAMLRAMRQIEPENVTQATVIAQDVLRLGLERAAADAQGDLFGDLNFGETPLPHRMRILDRTLKALKRDRGIFQRLTRDTDTIEQAGNRLARNKNEARAHAAEAAITEILRRADEPGAIRNALDAAARTAAAGNLSAGVREFRDSVARAIESGDFDGPPVRSGDGGRADQDAARGDAAVEILDEIDQEGAASGAIPLPAMREAFADPVQGPGSTFEADQAAREIAAALRDPSLAEPGLADLQIMLEEGAEPVAIRDLLADLEADAEFSDQLDICFAAPS